MQTLRQRTQKYVLLDVRPFELNQSQIEMKGPNHFVIGQQEICIDASTIVEILAKDEQKYRVSGPAGAKFFTAFSRSLPEQANLQPQQEAEPPIEMVAHKRSVLDKITRLNRKGKDDIASISEVDDTARETSSEPDTARKEEVNETKDEDKIELIHTLGTKGIEELQRLRKLEQEKLHWLQDKLALTGEKEALEVENQLLKEQLEAAMTSKDQREVAQDIAQMQASDLADTLSAVAHEEIVHASKELELQLQHKDEQIETLTNRLKMLEKQHDKPISPKSNAQGLEEDGDQTAQLYAHLKQEYISLEKDYIREHKLRQHFEAKYMNIQDALPKDVDNRPPQVDMARATLSEVQE